MSLWLGEAGKARLAGLEASQAAALAAASQAPPEPERKKVSLRDRLNALGSSSLAPHGSSQPQLPGSPAVGTVGAGLAASQARSPAKPTASQLSRQMDDYGGTSAEDMAFIWRSLDTARGGDGELRQRSGAASGPPLRSLKGMLSVSQMLKGGSQLSSGSAAPHYRAPSHPPASSPAVGGALSASGQADVGASERPAKRSRTVAPLAEPWDSPAASGAGHAPHISGSRAAMGRPRAAPPSSALAADAEEPLVGLDGQVFDATARQDGGGNRRAHGRASSSGAAALDDDHGAPLDDDDDEHRKHHHQQRRRRATANCADPSAEAAAGDVADGVGEEEETGGPDRRKAGGGDRGGDRSAAERPPRASHAPEAAAAAAAPVQQQQQQQQRQQRRRRRLKDGELDFDAIMRMTSGGGGGGGAGGSRHESNRPQHVQYDLTAADVSLAADQAGGGEAYAAEAAEGEEGEPLLLSWPGDEASEPLQLAVPSTINRHLRDYQREGVQFLFRQYAMGIGGILADDMGLGKTVQTIAFIAALLGKTGRLAHDNLPPAAAAAAAAAAHGAGAGQPAAAAPPAPAAAPRWPILVVVPSSVIDNWCREFTTWGSFRVAVYRDSEQARESALSGATLGTVEVVLTSYTMLRLHPVEMQSVRWHVAVFDEAHTLKNPAAETYKAAGGLETALRYGLSGTVMQNNYKELYAVMDFMHPGCLGERSEYMKMYARPMQVGQRVTADALQVGQALRAQRHFRAVVDTYLLRRTKALIADQLPRKRDYVVFCDLSDLQRRAYRRVLESPDGQLLVRCAEPCDCGSNRARCHCCHQHAPREDGGVLWPQYHTCKCDDEYDRAFNPKGCKRHKPGGCGQHREDAGDAGSDDDSDDGGDGAGGGGALGELVPDGGRGPRCPFCLMFPMLHLLRKISNHLDLLRSDDTEAKLDARADERDRQRLELDLARRREVAQWVLGPDTGAVFADAGSFLALSDTRSCGKLIVLARLLESWRGTRDKVLIFSHSRRMLRIIESFVVRQGHDYLYMDGETAVKERQGLVDTFNARPSLFLFLISTLAGGTGLNLTGANKVVILDPSWNPSHDLQAQDRAYRLGQDRDVSVYRLVATGTIEETVYSRQVYKQQQANMAVEGATERRYFEGVQGVLGAEGELWGLANLLRMTAECVLAKDVLQDAAGKRAVAAAAVDAAGVFVAAADGDDDDNDDDGFAAAQDDVKPASAPSAPGAVQGKTEPGTVGTASGSGGGGGSSAAAAAVKQEPPSRGPSESGSGGGGGGGGADGGGGLRPVAPEAAGIRGVPGLRVAELDLPDLPEPEASDGGAGGATGGGGTSAAAGGATAWEEDSSSDDEAGGGGGGRRAGAAAAGLHPGALGSGSPEDDVLRLVEVTGAARHIHRHDRIVGHDVAARREAERAAAVAAALQGGGGGRAPSVYIPRRVKRAAVSPSFPAVVEPVAASGAMQQAPSAGGLGGSSRSSAPAAASLLPPAAVPASAPRSTALAEQHHNYGARVRRRVARIISVDAVLESLAALEAAGGGGRVADDDDGSSPRSAGAAASHQKQASINGNDPRETGVAVVQAMARHRGVSVDEMCRQLRGMTRAQRDEARRELAAAWPSDEH